MPEPSDFTEVHQAIKADFMDRLPGYHKSRCEGLTLLASTVLNTRSVNLMEFAAALPRDIGFIDHRYQYVSRVLGNSHINCDDVMQAYATEVFTKLGAQGQTIVLMIDQSHANDGHEVLMVSVRMRDRALPVSWRVRKTKGAIGFPVQKDLLDGLLGWLPEGAKVVLMGDRFYGTAALVAWCQAAGWGYRLRMKGNITLQHQGGEMKSGEIVTLMPEGLVNAELHGSGVFSNIGALHEPGHQEPWIIAMDDAPGKYTVLDYGMRWGIEAMFSDFKSRGFGITQSQITRTDRLERLILVLTIAMYWAISTGSAEEKNTAARSGTKRGFVRHCDPCVPSSNKDCDVFEDALRGMTKCRSYGTYG